MKVRITSRAWRDLHAIGDWINQDDSSAAVKIVDELLDKAQDLDTLPLRFPTVPDTRDGWLRKRAHRNYNIYYRVTTEVEVVRFIHAKRDHLALIQDL